VQHDIFSLAEMVDHGRVEVVEAVRSFCRTRRPADAEEILELAARPEIAVWNPGEVVHALQMSAVAGTAKDAGRLLAHESPVSRFFGVHLVAGLPAAEARQQLVTLLDHDTADVAARAALLLRHHPTDHVRARLTSVARDGRTLELRLAAQTALVWLRSLDDDAAEPVRTVRVPARATAKEEAGPVAPAR